MRDATASPPLFALDRTLAESVDGGMLVLSGWCFGVDAPVRAIDVLIDGDPTPVTFGGSRPDVGAAYPMHAAAPTSGFHVQRPVAAGRHKLALRAHTERGKPVELARAVVDVEPPALKGFLETPGPGPQIAGTLRVSGWAFHPAQRAVSLAIDIGGVLHDCAYPHARPDVGAAFPAFDTAAMSGFEAAIALPAGHHVLALHAILGDGTRAVLRAPAPLVVIDEPFGRRVRRRLARRTAPAVAVVRHARAWVAQRGHLPRPADWMRLARKAWRLLTAAPPAAAGDLPGGFRVPEPRDPYEVWLECNRWTPQRAAWLRTRLDAAGALPTISLVMPVYKPDPAFFERAIETIRAQVHERWELCIADDASGDAALSTRLRELAARDPRIRVVTRAENGNISRATNSAAALAGGEFLCFVDQDDELAPDALGEIALALAAAPDADLLYTDDDKIDTGDRRYAPQFKPDWSPELLLSWMYVGHALVVRRSLFEVLGGFRAGFEGSQDFDFTLRAGERARRVLHVPLVLYHWRAAPGSTATSGAAKPASFAAGERAVTEALSRRGSEGSAQRPAWAVQSGIGIFGHAFPDDGPRVAILIPTKNQRDVLARCIESLSVTTYRNFEVVVIDNESDDPATLEYLRALPHRVLRIANPGPRFSFAHVNNEAARAVDAEYLLFLNNDTEVRTPRWLSQLVGYGRLPGVGAVGARLLYPDGRIQHAGILHGYYDGLPGPAFKLLPAHDHGYLSQAMTSRNYGAVTAACLLTRRALFLDVGGFDAARYAVAYNDVDYGFRLEARGLRCVYAPDAKLLHHEGASRGFTDDPRETAAYRRQYRDRVDPYYNPNLSLADERFAIAPRRSFVAAPPGPRRALMCAFNLNWEGAPYSQFELTRALRDRGVIDPVVFAPADGPLRRAYEDAGMPVRVQGHPLAGVHTAADYDAAIDRFAAWIGAQDVAVVYGNTLQTFYAIDAAHRLGVPAIWNPRESEPWQDYFRQFPDGVAARALGCYEKAYRVVFVAHATAQACAALDTRHNFTVIHNGLDRTRLAAETAGHDRAGARAELGLARDDVALLLLGTVCERKGQHDFPRALARLDHLIAPRVRAFIVGDRPSAYSLGLRALVDALPAERRRRVETVAETDDVGRYLLAADAFVCTSRVESYPRVILEAMAFGLPIVTTPVFGIREQVREGVNGLFYEPGDTVTLARHLTAIVGDDALRARLAANALPSLDALTGFDEMVERYARIFVEAAAP
jgi:O-antigen biosynthesis protein